MTTIILDFETSGLNPYHDDIIEIGAKVLNTDKSFQCLVKPKIFFVSYDLLVIRCHIFALMHPYFTKFF